MKSQTIIFSAEAGHKKGIILAFDGFKLLGSIQYIGATFVLNSNPAGLYTYRTFKDEKDTLDRIYNDMKGSYPDLRFEFYPIEE